MKPKVFVGSSTESLDIAYAVQENLDYSCEVTVWSQGLFDVSTYTLDSLVKALDHFDFGIFILGLEDIVKLRGKEYQVARDNVVFELGLFIGRLGRERNFLLIPSGSENFHLPTDLLGLTPATYRLDREDDNLLAALGPASNKLLRVIRRLGALQNETKLVVTETLNADVSNEAKEGKPPSPQASESIPPADQCAAVCYRFRDGTLEFLLIKASSQRWIFPKRNLEGSDSVLTAVASCALDEAGVTGRVNPKTIATFKHIKKTTGIGLLVCAHLLEVEREDRPVEPGRNPTWFAIEPAIAALIEGRTFSLYWEMLSVLHQAIDNIRSAGNSSKGF